MSIRSVEHKQMMKRRAVHYRKPVKQEVWKVLKRNTVNGWIELPQMALMAVSGWARPREAVVVNDVDIASEEVKDWMIRSILEVIKIQSWHRFVLKTSNAERLRKVWSVLGREWPGNLEVVRV